MIEIDSSNGFLAGFRKSALSTSPVLMLAITFLVSVVFCALFLAPVLSEFAMKVNIAMRLKPPFDFNNGPLYFLGSDALGRSLLVRIIYASKYTVLISLSAVSLALVVGGTLGVWAGLQRGWVGVVIMRFTDAVMSFPLLLLSIVLLYILQAQNGTIILVLAVSRVPLLIRVARAEVLKVREHLYVTAARTMNVSTISIVWSHIIPNIMPVLLTFAALEVALVMLAESSLSFIGLGVQPPELSWGMLVAQGSQYISSSWWLAAFPGLMIVLTALASNVLTSWLRAKFQPR